jgi:acetyl-CoA C-acetyltransferase
MAANRSAGLARIDVVGACVGASGPGLIGYAGGELADRHPAWGPRITETASLVAALPRKTSDQITAKRHPPSAPRVAQCVELFKQLRGDAVHQVYAARIALAHNIGGPTALSTVTLLEGPGTNGD